MKIKKYLLSAFVMTLIASAGLAQTAQQRLNINKHYDYDKVSTLSKHLKKVSQKEREEAFEYANAHGIPTVIEHKNGKKSYLIRMDSKGNLIYFKTLSLAQSKTVGADKLYPGGGLDLELEGEGMRGGVWDGGKVRGSHDLLDGKITYGDNASSYDDHATHVAGIMVGKEISGGQASLAKGMAYKADLDTYDWYQDSSEMLTAAYGGLLVSNHSYGIDLDEVPDPMDYLGVYGPVSKNIDNIAYLTPNYTIVTAAGNDRTANYNPGDGGYNLLGAQMATAKNDIVVAAVKRVTEYTGPSSVEMSSFSSWGPTSDRRIKPDISADGVGVFSSVAHDAQGNVSDDSYGSMSGTSMASPSVAGSILLLQELSSDLNNGSFLRSATVRAIIIETAHETGLFDGPDARFGWGLLNMEGAAKLMLSDNNKTGSFYDELSLNQGDTFTKTVEGNGKDLKVTIAWTDPAGIVQNNGDTSPVLVNDLDLRITDSQGNTYYPWRLHAFNNNAAALNDGDNDVDNVEQVVVSDAVEGEEYTIEVTHKGNLKSGKQDFSIAGVGAKPLAVESHQLEGFSIYPNPATNQVNINIENPGNQVEVAIFNINGKQVLNRHFTDVSGADETFDVSSLTSGVYFVKINSDGKTATKKLIVK